MSSSLQPAAVHAREEHALLRVAQPLGRHYNGQGVVRPSETLPLSGDGFGDAFGALWDEHVNFGTSVSHKKLKAKGARMEWRERLAAADAERPAAAGAARKKKRRRAPDALEGGDNDGGEAPPPLPPPRAAAVAAAPPPPQKVVASTKRFSGTLAAALLAKKRPG
jgi:hypothetical protein